MSTLRHRVGRLILALPWPLLVAPAPLLAQQAFGDISLEPLDSAVDSVRTVRGYAEYRFRLINQSDQRRTVELIAPFEDDGMMVPNHLDRIVRRVEVGPRANLVVTLLHPPLMLRQGGQVRVRVDGEDFEQAFTFSPGHASNFANRLNFLVSRSAEPIEGPLREAHQRRSGSGTASGGSATRTAASRTTSAPSASRMPVPPITVTISEQPVARWSSNWLHYTRFYGVGVTSSELQAAPAPIRQALYEYSAMGGLLIVLGPLPGWPSWPSMKGSLEGSTQVYPGFGVILALPADLSNASHEAPIWEWALEQAEHARAPMVSPMTAASVPFITPIGQDIRLPIRGLFLLAVLFALLLGPANLFLLHRKKRRVWLWWTVPATALAATGLLTGFSLFVEGDQTQVRTRSITLLDERYDQAFTVGDQGYFSTRSPAGGLFFSDRTEVVPLIQRSSYAFYRSILLEDGLRLQDGWLSARIPSHFQIRSPQRRRERLPVRITGSGVEVTNGLGAAIQQVWFCTLDGSVYWGRNIAAGEAETLVATGRKRPGDFPGPEVWRERYRQGWENEAFVPSSVDVLRPGTYVALLSDSPFLESGVPRITHSDRLGIVYGISTLSSEDEDDSTSRGEHQVVPVRPGSVPSGGQR